MKLSHLQKIILQIIGCLLFLSQPIWLPSRPPEEAFHLFSRPILRDYSANALMLIFFYLHYYLIIPKLYFTRKYLLYFSISIFAFCCIVLLPSLMTGRNPFSSHQNLPFPAHGYPVIPFFEEIKHHIFLFIAVVTFSLSLRTRARWYQAEYQRQQAELDSLKGQINPHFLFNTLNSIYSLVVDKDDAAADSIVHLSELMRYIIKEAKDGKIPLAKELSYLDNYIELQRARLGNTVVINFHVLTEDADGLNIAPLLLISLIENAFKYGVNPDEECNINIEITVINRCLNLVVRNKKVSRISTITSSGIGIDNTRERLQLIYPLKHSLQIENESKYYTANLSIELV